jgi:hypothetical protein
MWLTQSGWQKQSLVTSLTHLGGASMSSAPMGELEPPWKSWEERYRFQWDALDATIDYYSSLMEEWEW